MKLVLFVLNDPEKTIPLLNAWKEAGASGATVLFSTGMGRIHLSGALRDDQTAAGEVDRRAPGAGHAREDQGVGGGRANLRHVDCAGAGVDAEIAHVLRVDGGEREVGARVAEGEVGDAGSQAPLRVTRRTIEARDRRKGGIGGRDPARH